jgi:hypothetical protein
VVDAPPLPQDVPAEPPAWMQGLLEGVERAVNADERKPRPPRRRILVEHEPLCEHALDYVDWVFAWRRTHEAFTAVTDPADPRAVVSWFYSLIYVKIRRALRALAEDDPAERDWPADHDGSAKVALLSVERSQKAWLLIVERGHATWNEAEPFIRQLLWIRDEIERIFPNARAFVRPGFDEPDEVEKLLARTGTDD